MGACINVLMDHTVDDYRDQSAVLARLKPALPAAITVRDYFNRQDLFEGLDTRTEWKVNAVIPPSLCFRRYTAPGSLHLKIGPHAAQINAGGRWRGFLSIPPSHQVHLQAFRSIASALGATKALYFGDCDDVDDAFYEGGTVETGMGILTGYMGSPQPSVDEITAEIAAEAEDTVPGVWYYEDLRDSKP